MTSILPMPSRRAVMLLARLAFTAGWIVRHHLISRVGWPLLVALVAVSAAVGAVAHTIGMAL